MKIGLVYTSTTKKLIELVEKEIYHQLGKEVDILTYQNPDILSEAREQGYVTTKAAIDLYTLFLEAVRDGAEAILNICSSVGEAVDSVQTMAKYIGVPIVRIDEDMCREAVRLGNRIGVMATLSTTLEPTKNTIVRVSRELGKHVEIVEGLLDGTFGLNEEELKSLLVKKAVELSDKVDVILLCQGSMAYCEENIHNKTGLPVVSSPRFGAAALRKALNEKGVMKNGNLE